MRTCTTCGEPKPLDQFWRDRSKKHGYSAKCKPAAKLSLDMVMDIKGLIAGGFSNTQLAEMYPVSRGAILLIRREKNWRDVPFELWSPEGEQRLRQAGYPVRVVSHDHVTGLAWYALGER